MSEPNQLWTPVEGKTYEKLGTCIFANDNFVSFCKVWPPAAQTAQGMWDNGWEVYFQPMPYRWVESGDPDNCYITTYKRRNP